MQLKDEIDDLNSRTTVAPTDGPADTTTAIPTTTTAVGETTNTEEPGPIKVLPETDNQARKRRFAWIQNY